MKTRYNFQINPNHDRKAWEQITAHSKHMTDRVTAIHFAQRLARVFCAEIRMTEGADPFRSSGTYIR